MDNFYERGEVIHEVVEAERSRICYDLIQLLIANKSIHKERKKILDVGCGDGSFIVKFKECCEVFGIDISEKAVNTAKEAGINAYRVDVSCEKLPFESKYFDIVYMGDLIEHLVNPDFVVREVVRTIRLDGFLVLSTPNLASWLNRLLLLLGMQPLFSEVSTSKNFGRPKTQRRQDYVPIGHLRLYTYRALKEFLSYYRFRVVNAKGAPCERLPKVLARLDKFFSKFPSLSSIIIIVASKNK